MRVDVRVTALAGTALVGWWCAPAPAPVVPLVAAAFGIPRRLARPCGIALTFDDGPHPEGTPAVLDVLDRAGVRATFFLVGEQVRRWPTLAAEIAAAGHEIAIHGHRHVLLLHRSLRAVRDDYDRAAEIIGEAAGCASRCYRPPYGVFGAAALSRCRAHGWSPLLWSSWGRDWEARATPETIASRATRKLSGGDVVLLHDADHYSSVGSWRRTALALPSIIDAAAETGEPLVCVTQST